MFFTTEDRRVLQKLHGLSSVHDEMQRLQSSIRAALHDLQAVRTDLDRIILEKTRAFPWLSNAIAEYREMCDLKVAEFLDKKLRPAPSSAHRVRELAKEKRESQRMFRMARNRVRYYESLFPWLRDLVGEDLDELVQEILSPTATEAQSESRDPVQRFLTEGEYRTLSTIERNQRALDRYRASRRARWQLGRDYERYIGYTFEKDGQQVHYQGIVEGLHDLGRDLIVNDGERTLIVQCKYWRSERRIHEKHVFQLFGTTVEYFLKNHAKRTDVQLELFRDVLRDSRIKPLFITSTSLSDRAREFAAALGVNVRENVALDPDYPCIKCNVSRPAREAIYHLPMDQQYDATSVERERGEFYARTVADAEGAGFRRAWRWKGRRDADAL